MESPLCQEPIDFFISYNQYDTQWAEWIAWQLEDEGYHVKIQAWDFRPGNNFVLEMDKATSESSHTILILSPNFLQSHFCQPEWAAAFAKDPTGEKRKIIPIRVQPCGLDGLLTSIIYIDLVGLDKKKAKDLLIRGIEPGRSKPKKAPSFPLDKKVEEPRFPGQLPEIWNVPFLRNPNFTGRRKDLEIIENKLQTGSGRAVIHSISGLGGVGKTQLAVEYAYSHTAQYNLVWWIRAEDDISLLTDFSNLGEFLKLNMENSDKTSKVDLVQRWLESNNKWLLIFDNVQNPKDLYDPNSPKKSFLPQSHLGHIIITSRNPNWTSIASVHPIEIFSSDEAVEFLLKRTGQTDSEGAITLAHELGYLPLALEQAAAFIAETPGMTFQKYFGVFQERHLDLWKNEKPPINYLDTVATTWNISINQATKENRDSIDILNICAFLASEEIPISLFKSPNTNIDDFDFVLMIKCLKKYSLINATSEFISIHRLVQLITRDNLTADEKKNWISVGLFLLSNAFIFNPDDPKTWRDAEKITPHIVSIVNFAEREKVDLILAAELLGNIGGLYLRLSDYTQAKEICERALKLAESLFDPNHKEIASAANNLGLVLEHLGKFSDAKKQLERALLINEKCYGPDHERVALAASNLGSILNYLGDYPNAKRNLERSIAILQKNDASKYPQIAKSMNNLGLVFHNLGKYDEAKEQYEKALKIDMDQYGQIHPEVARDINNIGLILQDMGDYQNARVEYERAIKIYEELFGEDHLEVAVSYNNLGRVLGDLGDFSNAKIQLERALKIYEKSFGSVHPEIARVSNNLGVVLMNMKDLNGAKNAIERALSIDEEYYGSAHIEVATDVNNLGTLYWEFKDSINAKKQFERALRIGKKVYGSNHLHIAITLNNLGGANMSLKNFSDAKKQFERALKIQKKLYKTDNLETAKTLCNIGKSSMYLGELRKAESQFEDACRIFNEILGPENEYSKAVQKNISLSRYLMQSKKT